MKLRLLILSAFLLPLFMQAEQGYFMNANFTSFTARPKCLSDEFKSHLGSGFNSHPDAGYLPYRKPPVSNCFEVLSKRDAFSRLFIVDGSNGRHFFRQTAEAPINYLDKNGRWREINPRLKPAGNNGAFIADEQPVPLTANSQSGYIDLSNGTNRFAISHGVRLYHVSNGVKTLLSDEQMNSVQAGDDGLYFNGETSGVDLVYKVGQGRFEYSMVINRDLQLTSGELIMEASIQLSNGMSVRRSDESRNELEVIDGGGSTVFSIGKAVGFDANHFRIPLTMEWEPGKLFVRMPVSVLNRPEIKFPFVIDPTVTATNSLPLSSITGSGFGASCFTGGCNYSLSVPSPANATLTNVYFSFEYLAVNGLCNAEDGAFKIDFNSCTAPSAPPGVFTCAFPITNFFCSYSNQPLPEFISCLPAPSCAPQLLNFDLTFYRCTNDPSGGCSNNCIAASQPWIMTVEGETLNLLAITPSATICSGDAVPLQVLAQYGVPPYSYSWTGGAITDTVTVFPTSTTNYTATVTDACGNTVQGTSTVTVTPNANPGFTISPVNPCQGSPVTITGNGAAPFTDYDWTIPGAGLPGNIFNDNSTPIVTFSIAGTYPVTLNFSGSGCVFDSTITVTVNAPVVPDVLMTASPSTAVCEGTPITFTANPSNGGATPFYTWLVNGTVVQTGTTSFTIASLTNGDLVQLVMTSSLSCVDPVTDTASLFAPINIPVTPAVSITNTSGICEGDTLTFTANPTNGGTPSYQWLVNGSPSGTGAVFTTSTLSNGDVVSVIMTSNLACVTSPTANAQTTVSLIPRIIPAVQISASPSDTICAGQQVTLQAQLTGTGVTASYQWLVNSIYTGITGDEFSSSGLRNGDVVQAIATANGQCLTVNTDTSNIIRIISRPPVRANLTLPSAVCKGEPVTIQANATGGTGTYYYNWNVSSIDSSAITIIADSGKVIMVAVTDNCTVRPGLDTLVLNVLPGTVADFSYANPQPGSFNHELLFTNTSENATSFLWTFFDLQDTAYSNEENPVHQFDEEGEYDVLLVTQSPAGCIDSIRYKVIVKEEVAIYVPNAFTPDGDLKNDEFAPIGESVKSFQMAIYSRWGQKIFESKDLAWNGTVNGRMVENGVYLYRIETAGETIVGRVTVIR